MQNYGQQGQTGYQRPGSVTGFSAPAPPPPYGAPQGYQSAAPPNQSPAQQFQQWGPPQQAGGYNPGVYGAMPGGYSQGQSAQDVPPPPPPKPAGFAAAVHNQQHAQNFGQQPAYGAQHNTEYTQATGGYSQPYSTAAPPPPSQTPGGSYFPPPQTPQQPSRPGSIYGANQVGTYSTPASAAPQVPPSTIWSPNEHHPAYIPPSLTGQGTQSYMPANTNPMPGVYVPPPPDIPAWQQAQHAPLQGGKKFTYTKPMADSGVYGQGYQGTPPAQQQAQYAQPSQYATQSPVQQQAQFGQFPPQQQGQFGQNAPVQQTYGQAAQPQAQYSQQPLPQPYNQAPPTCQTPQQQFQQSSQWQAPADQGYGEQQQDVQTPYNAQAPYNAQQPGQQHGWQQYPQPQDAGIQAPRPINGHTGTTAPGFVSQPSPQSQPVSPLNHRQSMSFNSVQNQAGIGRTGSVSSIALGAIHAQRAGNRTESPKPKPLPPAKIPTPPPPRDEKTKFSALGAGGPSDWEHFGGEDEIDDEAIFGAKKEKDEEAPQELPAQVPSPISAPSEISSPPIQETGLPPSHHSGQSFVMEEAPPPSHQPQQGFVTVDAAAVPPSSTQYPYSSQYTQPPPTQQSFAMDDGDWASQSRALQQPQQSQMSNTFATHNDVQSSQQPHAHGSNAWDQQPSQAYGAELRAKDVAYECLRAESEGEKSILRKEIDELKVVMETVRRHAEAERNTMDEQTRALRIAAETAENAKSHVENEKKVLEEQIQVMKTTAEQAEANTYALIKEKDAAIERWKEDADGKDENVKEKETTILDLDKQIKEKDAMIEELRGQLEAEKSKELPKPTPADLVPDIDPWYAGSLERYITMLRSEAHEPVVEDKIQTFTAFLKAESSVRGLEYYNSLPAAPTPVQEHVQQFVDIPRKISNASITNKEDLRVHIPDRVQSPNDEFQYSPGGRPMLQGKPTTNQSFGTPNAPPSVSTTVLTPTSSQDDDFNKTPTSIQSPAEGHPRPQYKAYVPPGVTQEQSLKNLNLRRQSISFGNNTPTSSLQTPGSGKSNDDIFFGGPPSQTSSNPTSRPTTSSASAIPVPAPLFTPRPPSANIPALAHKKDPMEVLATLVPTKITSPQPNPQVEKVRSKLTGVSSDFSFIQELTTTWERSAALTRKKNDDARRKRQEESEENTDQLFNDHEISYADIGPIEDEFKEQERQVKAQEDKEEYDAYTTSVFDKVYERLHEDIRILTDIYIDAESLLQTSVSGLKSMEGGDVATTERALDLLKQVHECMEVRHEKVTTAVAERDKKYKKTEIQPAYAAGDIKKMKSLEKHFEKAEKQALARAKAEKADREAEFVHVVEEVIVNAVGGEQKDIDHIVATINLLPAGSSSNHKDYERVLNLAYETVQKLKESSKLLLGMLNEIEVKLNEVDGEAVIMAAKAEYAEQDRIRELEGDVKNRETELREEFRRRVGVIDQDSRELELLIAEKKKARNGSVVEGKEEVVERVVMSPEEEMKERLRKALEEAKRRNGDL
ncbi:hypothetical protein P280DRAFT_515256 [Massarina eburnea CBS 473.64]|uniref:Uncharacterized protein n=1 Tax=Massarina eburnea CBS 473.64 TaxID=1395130 RepID=A0A6A6S973_9PLEO|nr:hypothetical protein P280DRAFT_515256 [Massarina eburnea CBS 473.64]